MWPWGALPLRPPPHEPAGTCRVAWDALPLLPQAISASYFLRTAEAASVPFPGHRQGSHARLQAVDPVPFPELGKAVTHELQAVDPAPFPEPGKADTRGLQAVDPVPAPELGKADTRSGTGTGSTAWSRAMSGSRQGAESARRMQPAGRPRSPMRRNGERDSCRTRRRIRWALRAPCKFSGSAENLLRCRVLQATDPGPSPERVSAFPSSGEGPGSVACPARLPRLVIAPD